MSRNLELLRSSLARHGVARTVLLLFKNVAYALDRRRHYVEPDFDRKYGTDTSRNVGLGGLTIESAHVSASNQYQAIYGKRFGEIMDAAAVAHESFVFLDLGSGKGKALLLASSFPFKRIVGIEFARELHEVALRNIAIYRNPGQRCRDIALMCQDAMEYEFPEEPLFVFLNNPFGPAILGPVLANLRRSLQRAPRPTVVAYVNPLHGQVMEAELGRLLERGAATGELMIMASPDARSGHRA